MSERAKISPRARRTAEKNGLDARAIASLRGTGFAGGVRERDVVAWLESSGRSGNAFAASSAYSRGRVPAGVALRATPLARRIARAESVDLGAVTGTGAGGKVTKGDVLVALTGPAPRRADGTAGAAAGGPGSTEGGEYKIVGSVTPYTGVRRIIGERLASSKFTAPHLYFTQKVDMSELLLLRKSVNEEQTIAATARERVNEEQVIKTSVTDYIARACVIALQRYPDLNSSLIGDRIETYATINLGVAVASPAGLIVPVIKNAQDLSVTELSGVASSLINKARERKLKREEYSGGTFTLSNLGMFGIENFTAIINPPEVGILAISSTKDEPVVVTGGNGEKMIAIRPMMNITLSVDHRLIDGLLAAQFVTEVKRLLENPGELLTQANV